MRRAQTSVEFLIIFAVVISLTLLIISSLGLFPSVGKNMQEMQVKQYWQSEDIGIISYALNESHMKLFILNNFDDVIRVDSVYVDSVLAANPTVELSPGQSELITFTYASNLTSSDPYSLALRFEYTNLKDSQLYSLSGLSPIVGKVS